MVAASITIWGTQPININTTIPNAMDEDEDGIDDDYTTILSFQLSFLTFKAIYGSNNLLPQRKHIYPWTL